MISFPAFAVDDADVIINTREEIRQKLMVNEQQHEISNNVVCAISNASNQPAHMRSLVRAFASRLNIL